MSILSYFELTKESNAVNSQRKSSAEADVQMQVVLNKLQIFFLSNYTKGDINSKTGINI